MGLLVKIYEDYIDPIIPDVVKLLSANSKVVKFTDRKKFDDFLEKQKYFSASESHCFYSKKDLDRFHKGEIKSEEKCYMLSNVGEKVAVWDDKKKVGYIIPA